MGQAIHTITNKPKTRLQDQEAKLACRQCTWFSCCQVRWGDRCKFRSGDRIPRLKRHSVTPTNAPEMRLEGGR
ncbi:MAG: hypothetical protein A4E52_01832 [Pelotomaculum sp. PtaB.Bin013]|nr:MAG: hypothetical protein A4E52_01832 [Pelotomaculum sp. PtaB.Bin013]